MNTWKWLGMAAGLAALTACGADTDEMNAANVDVNAVETLPPVDTNVDMNVDVNAGNGMANDTNLADNPTDNTVNAY